MHRVGGSRRAALLAVVAGLLLVAPAQAGALEVGVGRADITPPTGYYMMGWVRSDGLIKGQHTRLWARVIVLQQGSRKVALVAEDLGAIPGGMLAEAAESVSDIGFSEQNVLDSASHTHAGPTGFYNFPTYNTVFMTINSPTDFDIGGTLDPQLYAFQVRQLALAIRRANANLGPGKVGWGAAQIEGLTENRSIEAHLANHGIELPFGEGSDEMDPQGPLHTIDPEVNVLRVDKIIDGRQVPVGMWSTFADHGTINRFQFNYYNRDHHGAATHFTEDVIRRIGKVPAAQDVVTAYGNSDEGDISAGLNRFGPAAADGVGRVESQAFIEAWREAGQQMQAVVPLDLRWTRMCWCGQMTAEGPVADQAAFGLAEFTGSEEGRGPLFDITHVPFEGQHLPVGTGPQGKKIFAPLPVDIPTAVPLIALRIGSRMVVSIPGEMTAEMGRRVRAAVLAAASGSGIQRAVISGLANEYSSYFTTPEEYDAQHYEGAATLYGRASSVALQETLVALTNSLVGGGAAPEPYPFDPRNGVTDDAPPFPPGAEDGSVVQNPLPKARRLARASFAWQGGARGLDRPLDQPFVVLERRNGETWIDADSDLGLNVLWRVDDEGLYEAVWEPPLGSQLGTYRFQVRANRYQLTSPPFRLRPSLALSVRRVAAQPGAVAVALDYPAAVTHQQVGDPPDDFTADLTFRPPSARGGVVTFLVDGQPVTVRSSGTVFQVPASAGDQIVVRSGSASDRFGNRNAAPLSFTA